MDVFISLEDAAAFEGIKYKTLAQRIARNPQQFKTKIQPREGGGKDQVMIPISSLSPKGRKAWKAAQKVDGKDVIIDNRADTAPWYVGVDLSCFIEGDGGKRKKAYYEAVELAARVQDFIDYDGPDRTAYAERYALGLGVSLPTLYRYVDNVLKANAWALKLEREDGQNREYFRTLSLCRKPREKDTFPSLTDEQRALIENIWFDKRFAANLGTIEMLYEKFEEVAEGRGWVDYPSIKTVARYVKHLMDSRGAESARYLAANGTREWRNKMMLKGKRDTTTLDVMEVLVGDEHTFDLWVQYTAPNGKVKAVRPVLTAWMDVRSRAILGDVICVKANGDTIKESLVKVLYTAGVPKRLLIDNGKDYTKQELTGQNRKKRNIDFDFDAETKGFYQSIGIQGVDRALPYQGWVKDIERLFRTVCSRFSKWFTSYTGTLTSSKTEDKRSKDIDGMLERGELLTMEEFYEVWTKWKEEKYHTRKHRGLTETKEKWVTPGELFANGPRYIKAAPPREYAAMLLMKADTARVYNQGIHKFGTLERQVNGGEWETVYTGPGLAFTDQITKGWQTVAYRVRAYDEASAYSGFAVSETREVNNNTPPAIVCEYPANTALGLKNEGFEIPYTVEDEEGDAVTITEAVDGAALRTFSVELGGENSFQLTGEAYMRILNGTHTLTITASDGSSSAVHSLGFTKAVTEASVKLAQPMEADGPISVCVLSVSGFIPEDAEYSVEVTNNALDEAPVWEDCTAAVRAGVNHVFENGTAANGFAFDFRLKAKRGESGVGGYITSVQGGFQ